jgi:endonuclease YncB( thermonuclease family)
MPTRSTCHAPAIGKQNRLIDRDRDVYGRLLRDVQVDGADVDEAMMSAGVARDYGGGRRSWC